MNSTVERFSSFCYNTKLRNDVQSYHPVPCDVRCNLKLDSDVAAIRGQGLIRVIEIVAWVVAYLALVEWAGFVITASVLMLVLLLRMGTRWTVAVAVSVVVVPLAYQVFAVALRVPLPRGWLGW